MSHLAGTRSHLPDHDDDRPSRCRAPRGRADRSASFEDVVRNLRNPDPTEGARRAVAAARGAVSGGDRPIAPLVNDPVDEIQLEAIAAELSFFLVEPVDASEARRVVVEVRTRRAARSAFERGPLAVWPKPRRRS